MRLGLFAMLLAACSFPHGEGGQQDARKADASEIDAAKIDAPMTMIDGGIDAAMMTDTDGDGILDSADNCPTVANANQRDHDADLRGDVCDKCPHLASATDPDGDIDGVGDACDPRPTTGGDSIALFEGFYEASSINNWNVNGGSWSVANGVLTQSSTSTADVQLVAPVNLTRAAVTSSAHVNALGTPTTGLNLPHASVAAGVASGPQWYWCSVLDDPNGGDKIYATTDWNGTTTNYPNANWPGTWGVGSDVRMTAALLGGNDVCTVVQGTTAMANVTGPIGPPAGQVQVASRTMNVSFDYVFVVAIGP